MNKVTMIVDLQYGSTGKGLIAGYLAETRHPDVVVTANMPNAGHTYINSNGRKWVHKVLPNSIVSPKLKFVLIGPGAVISIERLLYEVSMSQDILHGVKVLVHPNTVILQKRHKAGEVLSDLTTNIGSTAQGSGSAVIDKINRGVDCRPLLARDVLPSCGLDDYLAGLQQYRRIIDDAEYIIAEGAQGYSLGINQRFWPYCTSRECTPAKFLSDMQIPVGLLGDVIGCARTYPIRVGGNSGPCYPDQEEIEWSDIGVEPEKTTVTNRERRVFTFSNRQIAEAIWETRPDSIFLNFANYVTQEELDHLVETINIECDSVGGGKVGYIGRGPCFDDVECIS